MQECIVNKNGGPESLNGTAKNTTNSPPSGIRFSILGSRVRTSKKIFRSVRSVLRFRRVKVPLFRSTMKNKALSIATRTSFTPLVSLSPRKWSKMTCTM
jgi:hypothetical protein